MPFLKRNICGLLFPIYRLFYTTSWTVLRPHAFQKRRRRGGIKARGAAQRNPGYHEIKMKEPLEGVTE